jgi:hypothetical protein
MFLGQMIDNHLLGRQSMQREPAEPITGQTAGGLDFATQQCSSRSPFGDAWYATYWMLQLDALRVQPMIGIASRPEGLTELLGHVWRLIDAAEVVAN